MLEAERGYQHLAGLAVAVERVVAVQRAALTTVTPTEAAGTLARVR